MTRRPSLALLLLITGTVALAGCAGGPPTDLARDTPAAPPQWHAALPHDGSVADLSRWWQQFDDPLVAELQDAAQAASPSLASARARIEQARATRVAAGAALLPALDGVVGATRGRQQADLPVATTATAGAQAAWELDVFGGGRAARAAAEARFAGAEAGWHAARVSVAAEVANTYVSLRACEARLEKVRADSASRRETSRLTELATRAGFEAPQAAALARASAAQGNSLALQVQAQCDVTVKSLVALTALDEPALRERLATRAGRLPVPALLAVGTVPADVLNQRPDLYTAARDVEAASGEVAQARAARWPRVTLGGSFGRMRVEAGGGASEATTWAVGPLNVSLPLFDAGRRRADVDAARARYDDAVATYRGRVRDAVREVEQALVDLGSAEARREDARTAAADFDTSYKAVEARYRGGLGSLFELEDARRSALQAQVNLVDLERERVAAWVALYRALGGGWSPDDPPGADAAVSAAPPGLAVDTPPTARSPSIPTTPTTPTP